MPSPEFRLAILGDPVSHSLSPAMHEAALRECGLNGSYRRIRVKTNQLSQMLGQLRRKGYHGFNVTIPHKETVLPLLPSADDSARKIRAVNTVSWTGDGYKGFNTDATGFSRVTQEAGLSAGRALVLGAGGASRACCYSLLNHGWSVTVANRSLDRARSLDSRVELIELGDPAALQGALDDATLVVNATPVGMNHPDESPLSDQIVMRPGHVVFDLVYVPLDTRLLQEARRAGATTIDGLALLAAQAADSFEIWTDHRLPDSFFREAASEGALMSRALTFQFGQFGISGGEVG